MTKIACAREYIPWHVIFHALGWWLNFPAMIYTYITNIKLTQYIYTMRCTIDYLVHMVIIKLLNLTMIWVKTTNVCLSIYPVFFSFRKHNIFFCFARNISCVRLMCFVFYQHMTRLMVTAAYFDVTIIIT